MICDSPSEIYNHAVPFSPSSSWLHKCYSPELLQQVKVVKGIRAEWGKCSRTVSLGPPHPFFPYPEDIIACWGDIIASCCGSPEIIILNAITGTSMSVLYGHTQTVKSLTFSLDGAFLVSGGYDAAVKLWDIQTGGVVNTFYHPFERVYTASISPDCTTIASGSEGNIHLWDIQTENRYCIIKIHLGPVNSVRFSPTNPKHLVSISNGGTIRQWDINGHQVPPTYKGCYVAFSPDGTYFVSWENSKMVAEVRNINFRIITANIQLPNRSIQSWCFSPDGKFLAGSTSHAVYVWDLTNSGPCLVETLIEQDSFRTIALSSSHIFSGSSGSIKFWPISTTSADSSMTDSESTQHTSASVMSITLQGKDGIAISTDSAGVVKTWDILTGLCKSSFSTKAGPQSKRDAQLIDGKLIFSWCTHKKTYIWNTGRKKRLQSMDVRSNFATTTLRISGDGSKVFLQDYEHIQALSTWTGEVIGEVKLKSMLLNDPLIVDGSKVWVCSKYLQTEGCKGWDFGIPGSNPVPLSEMPPDPDRPRLDFIDGTKGWNTGLPRIEDTVTGEVVYQLPRRYGELTAAKWDGQFLVAGYKSGEVLIFDFIHMIPQ